MSEFCAVHNWVFGRVPGPTKPVCLAASRPAEWIADELNKARLADELAEALSVLLNHTAHFPQLPLRTVTKATDALAKYRGDDTDDA